MNMKNIPMRSLSVALLAVTLAGCATTRSEPDANGVRWPAPEDSYLKEGAFVAPTQFPLIRPGLSKAQVQLVLGLPHFREGLAGVDDWNYRFNFHTDSGVLSCQYQVQYDEEEKVTASHWRTSQCAALAQAAGGAVTAAPVAAAAVAAPAPAAAATPSPAASPTVTVLFDFDRAAPLSAQARRDLAALAAQSKQGSAKLTVTGHADRLGTAEHNHALSLSRARQVADALVEGGVAENRIDVVAKGSTDPVSDCSVSVRGAELVSCLQPDRRVTVRVAE